MRKSRLFATLGALALCSLAPAAQAQRAEPPPAYRYDFEPDDLVGETLSTTPALLKIRPQPRRIMLLRPRASFVSELLKSVEVL